MCIRVLAVVVAKGTVIAVLLVMSRCCLVIGGVRRERLLCRCILWLITRRLRRGVVVRLGSSMRGRDVEVIKRRDIVRRW